MKALTSAVMTRNTMYTHTFEKSNTTRMILDLFTGSVKNLQFAGLYDAEDLVRSVCGERYKIKFLFKQ